MGNLFLLVIILVKYEENTHFMEYIANVLIYICENIVFYGKVNGKLFIPNIYLHKILSN